MLQRCSCQRAVSIAGTLFSIVLNCNSNGILLGVRNRVGMIWKIRKLNPRKSSILLFFFYFTAKAVKRRNAHPKHTVPRSTTNPLILLHHHILASMDTRFAVSITLPRQQVLYAFHLHINPYISRTNAHIIHTRTTPKPPATYVHYHPLLIRFNDDVQTTRRELGV